MSEFSTVWIRIDSSGDRKRRRPSIGEANFTPSSVIFRIPRSEKTWNPPESVRIGRSQCMKSCSPLWSPTTSSPGRSQRWKVLPRMIWAPLSFSSSGVIDFTVPQVPTGMKIGVCTTP